MGLRRPKHFKCVHPESAIHMEPVLFSSFSSRPSLFYRSEGAEGAQSLDHIASPTPCMCELIQVSTCVEILAICMNLNTFLLRGCRWRVRSSTPKIRFHVSTGLRWIWQSRWEHWWMPRDELSFMTLQTNRSIPILVCTSRLTFPRRPPPIY